MPSASSLASFNSRSRFIVMRSPSDRKPSRRASTADVETLAIAMVSKSRAAEHRRSTDRRGRASVISLQPPPAGSSPTPVSTRPMYSSACACRRAAWSAISAPPPRQKPNGAATTGRGQNLMAAVMRWNARTAKSTSSHSPSCALSSSCIRFAPTEKLSRVAGDHERRRNSAPRSPSARSVSVTSRTMSSPMAFFFECSSRHATPSPRSTSDAPGFCADHAVRGAERRHPRDALRLRNRRGRRRVTGSKHSRRAPVPGCSRPPPAAARHCAHRLARRLHALHGRAHARGVPQLERAHLPVEARPHGAIDAGNVVGDLRQAVRRVVPERAQQPPVEARGLVLARVALAAAAPGAPAAARRSSPSRATAAWASTRAGIRASSNRAQAGSPCPRRPSPSGRSPAWSCRPASAARAWSG